MEYTLKLNIDIDTDNIISENAMEEYIKQAIDSASVTISNVKIVNIYDERGE